MKIRANTAAIFILILFPLGILTAKLAGVWITESTKTPQRLETGDFAGEYNPGDIRGSYSFADVEKAFEIPVNILAEAFGFTDSEDPASIQAKEFEELYVPTTEWEIGTDSLRLFTALYTGIPYTPEETTALPGPAAKILKDKGSLSEEQVQFVKERTVSLENFLGEGTLENEAVEHDESEDTTVKGKTMFSDVLSWGVSQDEIEAVLGMEMGPRTTLIRDFCEDKGLEFGTVKIELQALIDEVQ